jgi:outer membrane lipoprotein-sorting protein
MRKAMLGAALCLVCVARVCTAADMTPGQVLEKMALAAKDIKSMEADMAMTMAAQGAESKGRYKGEPESARFVINMDVKAMGADMKMNMVSDGKNMWIHMIMQGQNIVMKGSVEQMKKMGGGGSQNPLEQIKQLEKEFDFKAVKEEQVGGRAAYVLEGGVKENAEIKKQAPNVKSARIFVDKQDWMVRKTEVLDDQGKSAMVIELANLKTNIKIDEALFTFTPPEGAQVMDMGEMMKMQGAPEPGDKDDDKDEK